MWEPPNPCGVGVVYDAPGLPAPLPFAAVVPSCVIEAFLDRFQQINQAEAFAGIIALASLGEAAGNRHPLRRQPPRSARPL